MEDELILHITNVVPMIPKLYALIICHFVGDYVLQSDFIAKTKGSNTWHMIAHAYLYIVPFCFAVGWCWQMYVILFSHYIIDTCKARYNLISYATDQVLHIALLSLFFI